MLNPTELSEVCNLSNEINFSVYEDESCSMIFQLHVSLWANFDNNMIESNYNRGHFIKHKTDQVKVLETSRQKLLGMEFDINLEF